MPPAQVEQENVLTISPEFKGKQVLEDAQFEIAMEQLINHIERKMFAWTVKNAGSGGSVADPDRAANRAVDDGY